MRHYDRHPPSEKVGQRIPHPGGIRERPGKWHINRQVRGVARFQDDVVSPFFQRVHTALRLGGIRALLLQTLQIGGRPEQLRRVLASGNFFSLLGVSPLAGRLFDEQDDTPGKDNVAVLSASAWAAYFGSDHNAIGRSVSLNGISYTVIGVLPPNAALKCTRPAISAVLRW